MLSSHSNREVCGHGGLDCAGRSAEGEGVVCCSRRFSGCGARLESPLLNERGGGARKERIIVRPQACV